MNKQKEKKQLDKLWKKMQKRFKGFRNTGHVEQLHQFRIQVKKIRSFLTLLEAEKKNHGLLKAFKPVKKIFKSAGVVRDAGLHCKQAEEHGIHLNEQNQREKDAQQKEREQLFRQNKKQLRTMKKVKKKLHQHLHALSKADMKTFFQNQIDITNRLLSTNHFTEELHNGRKALKHLLYNQQAVQEAWNKKPGLDFSYIDELQEALGNWHDNKLTLDYFSGKLDAKDIDSLEIKKKALQETVTQNANGFLQKINHN